jgi:flavin reductase (DIM6/NTAB) family NADH-FMN oxidoreductase RutF
MSASAPLSSTGSAGIRGLRELIMPVVIVAASEPSQGHHSAGDRSPGSAAATSCATSTTSYVSLSPPVLAVALSPDSRTAQMIDRTGRFSLSVLRARQADLAQRAGRKSTEADKMAEAGIEPEPAADCSWPPGVADAAAVLWCSVTGRVPVGDHLLIFGQVEASRAAKTAEALLLRHQRQYLASGEALPGRVPDGYPI